MVNITRFNPLEDAFENLFRGVPVWLPNPEARAPAPMQFRMDVTENDKEYQEGGNQHNYQRQRSCGIRGSEARKRRRERRDSASRRALLRQDPARVRARSGGRRSDRPSQVQRRRAGAHAAEENRSSREEGRSALSGASNTL